MVRWRELALASADQPEAPVSWDEPFAIAVSVFVAIMSVVMAVVIIRMNVVLRHWSDEEQPDREMIRRNSNQMLYATGAWMISIGLLLIAIGSWVNSIGVIGVGLLIIVGAWHNLFTGRL